MTYRRSTPALVAAAATIAALTALPALPAAAQTRALTAEQVRCNGDQLAELAARTRVERPAGPGTKSIGVAYTFASRFGDLAGLAYTQQFFRDGRVAETPEHHLWFSGNSHEVRMLRNPARPPLPALSLTRNALNSDLVGAGHPDRFEVLIDPTLAGGSGGSSPVAGLLRLDNLEGPAGLATSAKPGRGLLGVVGSCHDRFTDADVHVFALLAKTLRAFPFDEEGDSRDSVMTLYRDASSAPAGAGTSALYRIDVLPLGGDGGSMARASFTFEVEISDTGRLGHARLAALPVCSGGQTTACTEAGASAMLVLSEPVVPSEYWSMTPGTPSACTRDLLGLPGCGPWVELELGELLAGTTWLQVR